MDAHSLRHLYTEFERRNPQIHYMRREDAPPLVRYVNERTPRSFIPYSQLNAAIAEETILREIRYFKMIGHQFEWKVYDYDAPTDLLERLRAHGFAIEAEEAVLVLALDPFPVVLEHAPTHDIRQVSSPEDVWQILNTVQNPVFGDPADNWLNEWISNEIKAFPDHTAFFAAYVDEQPVSAAWIRYSTDASNPFAGLYGGATLEAFRGRGIYRALVAARARHAIARGVQYLVVDASPFSRPILEKVGFVRIASAWEATKTADNVVPPIEK